MKTQCTTKAVIVTAIILLVGGTMAFAHAGWGYGGNGPQQRGYGGRMMGPGIGCENGQRRGRGACYEDLSDEEAAKLETTREKFYAETKDLRRDIRDLREDLRAEMVKDDPNREAVLKLRKTLSNLEGDFDQKAMLHRLEMRKLVPEKYRGRGFGKGYGRGGGRGGGRCWE